MRVTQKNSTELEKTGNLRRLIDPLSRDLVRAESHLLEASSSLLMHPYVVPPQFPRPGFYLCYSFIISPSSAHYYARLRNSLTLQRVPSEGQSTRFTSIIGSRARGILPLWLC